MSLVRFLSRASVLDSLYRFIGGESRLHRFSMGPIDPVHDVSRQMELNAQEETLGGLIWAPIVLTHAGADTQEGTYDPYSITSALPPLWTATGPPDDVWCWLLHCTVVAEAAVNLTAANLTVAIPFIPGKAAGFAGEGMDLVFRVGAAEIAINESITNFVSAYIGTNIGPSATQNGAPLCIPRGGLVRALATSAAAGGSRFNMVFWFGKIGTYPPGYG